MVFEFMGNLWYDLNKISTFAIKSDRVDFIPCTSAYTDWHEKVWYSSVHVYS